MTIRIPEKNLTDRILAVLGKKRAFLLPRNIRTDSDDGRYTYSQVQKESFLKALLRSKNKPLPDGWIYIDENRDD